MQSAVVEAANITGGSVDYIIANGGLVAPWSRFDPVRIL